jgi:hypothetical protein
VKIKTADLLARVNDAIEQCTAARDRRHADALTKYEQALAEWQERNAPRVAEVVKALAAKVRKGQPILRADVRPLGDGFGSGLAFQSDGPPKPEPVHVPVDLQALQAFLSTVADDTVSSSALADMGFRNVGTMLRPAATR